MPPAPTLLDHVRDAGQSVVGIGKISDIFAGRGIGDSLHSEGNDDGMPLTLEALATLDRGLLFVNLVDFDMVYGHRNDAAGFARALAELDAGCPSWRPRCARTTPCSSPPTTATIRRRPAPTTPASRCRCWRSDPVRPRALGTRASFCDLGQTIADGLGVAPLPHGESFLAALHVPGMKRAPLRCPPLIAKKRDGGQLDDGEIRAVIAGAAAATSPTTSCRRC